MIHPQFETGLEHKETWSRAKSLLVEAESMDINRAPSGVIHTSYYVMHHAARAVLLLKDGERAAGKHRAVIGRFGQIAKGEAQDAAEVMRAGRHLNMAYEARLNADYNVRTSVTPADAADWLQKARDFLAVCERHFDLS